MSLALGYNTNGLAHHTLEQILILCSKYGYRGIALTLDTHHLNPFRTSKQTILQFRQLIEKHSLRVVIETGGRYILDIERKHYPTLLHQNYQARLDFLIKALEIGSLLKAEALSFWSGILPVETTAKQAKAQLFSSFSALLKKAHHYQIPLALEPEPGMFIETVAQGMEWVEKFSDPLFGLTLDLGHLECMEEHPLDQHIYQVGNALKNVHVEDIRNKKHEHLPFGEGDMDYIPLLKALEKIQYNGLVSVELSRNSHDGPFQMKRSLEFLNSLNSLPSPQKKSEK